jgi:hypothetical protein
MQFSFFDEKLNRMGIEDKKNIPGYIPNDPPPADQLKPYNSFDDTNEDLFVYGIYFDAPVPYMRVLSETDENFVEYYTVPKAMAYYATWHAGYTQEGHKLLIQRGRQELARDIRKILDPSLPPFPNC